jgi:diguanylate cyclase (GGDEF)-like protein
MPEDRPSEDPISAPVPTAARAELDAAIARLWIERRDGVVDRIGALGLAANAMTAGQLTHEVRAKALQEAHKLKGTVGTFKLWTASRLVASIEEAMRDADAAAADVGQRLSDDVARLRELVIAGPEIDQVPRTEPDPHRIVVTGEKALMQELADSASREFDVAYANDADAVLARVTEGNVAALVVLRSGPPAAADLALLQELANRPDGLLSVVVADIDDLASRIRLSELGATRILPTGTPTSRVVQTVAMLLGQPDDETPCVLLVDDDEAVLEVVELMLQKEGIKVEKMTDPRGFWHRLSESTPDLVILDEMLPHISGLELCRVIRSDGQWFNLPVMFLTSRTDAAYVEQVFAAGADDFVAKPIVGPELVARIRNRLERSRLLRQLAEIDPLTGVANRRRSEEDLHHLAALAARTGCALSVAVVDVDLFTDVNDAYGHAIGDGVLRRLGAFLRETLRTNDVVGRWGGEEFVLGLFGASRRDAAGRLRRLLATFSSVKFGADGGREFSVSFSAGVAAYPTDGLTIPDLYRAADRALYEAKRAGRSRVAEAEHVD